MNSDTIKFLASLIVAKEIRKGGKTHSKRRASRSLTQSGTTWLPLNKVPLKTGCSRAVTLLSFFFRLRAETGGSNDIASMSPVGGGSSGSNALTGQFSVLLHLYVRDCKLGPKIWSEQNSWDAPEDLEKDIPVLETGWYSYKLSSSRSLAFSG